ncbi:MAG: AhpC/TSA family protein [Planctomycetales bacterium]|nr:AhpC/TSA family protein [Planctomycetales bacterium]
MSRFADPIREAGAKVLAVSFARPDKVATFLEKYPQPFPVVCDPTLAAYREFQVGRTSWLSFARPDVTGRFIKTMFRGQMPAKPDPADDLLQLGGDFILDRDRHLIYSHPSSEATDRPSGEELLAVLRDTSAASS